MARVRTKNGPRDGRAANGGIVPATPGASYPQRSDLQSQPVRTAPGQPYGQASAQRAAQQAVPIAGAPAPATGGGGPAPGGRPVPGAADFFRPTERPNEPTTHCRPSGPGAGPEAFGMDPSNGPTMITLRAAVAPHPS